MNSAEQKDYEHATPSDEEVQEIISVVRFKLDKLKPDNQEIKSGYEAAVDILKKQIKNPEHIPPHLTANKSKAIAILAVNYLNGECSREVLLGFGLPD